MENCWVLGFGLDKVEENFHGTCEQECKSHERDFNLVSVGCGRWGRLDLRLIKVEVIVGMDLRLIKVEELCRYWEVPGMALLSQDLEKVALNE